MVIIMLSLNKKLKQIQTSIKREVYSASGRNTSLSYNTQNHMNIIVDGFEDTEKSVKGTVRAIMEHPLIPEDIMVRGFIIDSVTGELTKV